MIKKYEERKKSNKNSDNFVQVEGDAEEEQKKSKFPFNKNKQQFAPVKTQAEIEKSRPNQQFMSYDDYNNDMS